MLRKIFYILTAFFVLTVTAPPGLATSIERNPTKREGAGAPFQIRRGKKWGYMNRVGKIIIDPQFDSVGDFFHGLARVRKNGKWGYINEKGEEAIQLQFDDALDFLGELAPARLGRKWGYIDLNGNWVVSPQFQAAGEYFDGLARVLFWSRIQCGHSKFYTNENAPDYVYVMPTMETALTSQCYPVDAKYGFLDKSGRLAIETKFAGTEDFSEGLAAFWRGGKFGYIDVGGKEVIPPQFDSAEAFSEGMAQVSLNGAWGYIDKRGNWVIAPSFSYGGAFSEGLARVVPVLGKGTGYIDKTGKMVIEAEFEEAWDFREGLAPVWKNQQWSYIDKSGVAVLRMKNARWGFSDGLTIVGDYPDRLYMNKHGQVVAQYEVGSQF